MSIPKDSIKSQGSLVTLSITHDLLTELIQEYYMFRFNEDSLWSESFLTDKIFQTAIIMLKFAQDVDVYNNAIDNRTGQLASNAQVIVTKLIYCIALTQSFLSHSTPWTRADIEYIALHFGVTLLNPGFFSPNPHPIEEKISQQMEKRLEFIVPPVEFTDVVFLRNENSEIQQNYFKLIKIQYRILVISLFNTQALLPYMSSYAIFIVSFAILKECQHMNAVELSLSLFSPPLLPQNSSVFEDIEKLGRSWAVQLADGCTMDETIHAFLRTIAEEVLQAP